MSLATLFELRQAARRREGRIEEALLDCEQALRLLPQRDSLIVDRAQIYRDMHGPAERGGEEPPRLPEKVPDAPAKLARLVEKLELLRGKYGVP